MSRVCATMTIRPVLGLEQLERRVASVRIPAPGASLRTKRHSLGLVNAVRTSRPKVEPRRDEAARQPPFLFGKP